MICIVEGDESVSRGLLRLIESAGLEATVCDCVEKLLSHAEHGEANCALLDLSGQDLREPALRSRLRALSATLPLIALSARDDETTRRLAREVGARAFFRKPVDAAALLDSIGWLAEPDHPH